jgi:deoxyribonuclease-4
MRIDEFARKQLSLPLRRTKCVQPYAVADVPDVDRIYLRFKFNSEIEYSGARLALENLVNSNIVFNGKEVDNSAVGYFVDKEIKTCDLPAIIKGENILEISMPFGVRTDLENCFILGEFGTGYIGKEVFVKELPKTLTFGDVVHQGLAFYGANITYKCEVETKENGILSVLAHAPYTMNACAKDEGLREFAKNTMLDDIMRLDNIEGAMYNFHPGSHVSQGADVGIDYISSMLNEVIKPDQKTIILLETMAGKGSEVGRNFEEIRAIIDKVKLNEKLGVCLDTCHVYDGGYDIVNDLDNVLLEFDRIIGLDRLKAIHLNDTKNPFQSHKDRHEKIGEGHLGIEAITRIINHEKLRDLPFFLETPNDIDGYEREIALLKEMYKY